MGFIMNENNALANLAEQTMANIEANQQPQMEAPKEPMYTLSQAYDVVKEEYGLMSKSEAFEFLNKVSKAFRKIKYNDYANKFYAQYTGEDIEYADFEDIDIESFVNTCEQIYKDYKHSSIDIPYDLVDDDGVEEYFKDNIDEFWYDIKNDDFCYADVVNAYFETLDLSMECFNLEN